jgi:hypothetical protein
MQSDRQLAGNAIAAKPQQIESTVRYLGVDVEDALTLAEHTKLRR